MLKMEYEKRILELEKEHQRLLVAQQQDQQKTLINLQSDYSNKLNAYENHIKSLLIDQPQPENFKTKSVETATVG